MRYLKPDYFEDFKCIAGECPDTCCAGWQIMIDEESLDYYGEVPGAFGKRLRDSIDWQEGSFYQCEKRCAFLNEKDLCDIYTELGEGALCQTCKNYPRHVEEFEGLREYTLSLSCPMAAEMILGQQRFPVFVETEDDAEEELAEEFEDFDILLFTQLEDARAVVMKHLKDTDMCLEDKLVLYLQFSKQMQECIDKEEFFEIDTVIRRFEDGQFPWAGEPEEMLRFMHRKDLFAHIYDLERLREEWTDVLDSLEENLYAQGEEDYRQKVEAFEGWLQEDSDRLVQWEQNGLQLFVFFLYTYFCGAVYDDWIYSKMALAVESVRFIRELYMAHWVENGALFQGTYVELAYRYAREIEHSDLNLNTLEEYFEERR